MPVWLNRWLERHQHPASLCLHIVGIPMALASGVVAVVQLTQDRWDLWWRPLVLLFGGYLFQWIGHRLEGNDVGEIILVKRMLGRPYTAVSPRYAKEPTEQADAGHDKSQGNSELG